MSNRPTTSAHTATDDQSTPILPAGCDDGHFAIKICAGPGKFFTIPARAWPGRLNTAEFKADGGNSDLLYETAAGEIVTITANDTVSPAIDTRSNDYPTSGVNRALVAHSLKQAGFTDNDGLYLVTGLPVDRYYVNGLKNEPLIEAKRINLTREVRTAEYTGANGILVPTKSLAKVVKHDVISEAVAAFLDALLDYSGNPNADFAELSQDVPIPVVDVGGKTLDIAVVKEGGGGLYDSLSGTADIGALNLYDQIDIDLRNRFSIADSVPFNFRLRAIQTGKYRLYGVQHDVKDLIDNALDAFAEQVGFEVSRKIGDASKFGSKVIFVGGGAELLKNHLSRVFPRLPVDAIHIPAQPEFANARGMYKAARANLDE
jgi:plasmid segregation protein ParM